MGVLGRCDWQPIVSTVGEQEVTAFLVCCYYAIQMQNTILRACDVCNIAQRGIA